MCVVIPHWIYGGISLTTKRSFFVAATDAGVVDWASAMGHAARLGARVPSREELGQIFFMRGAEGLSGSFDETGLPSSGNYWSSSRYGAFVWTRRFKDGRELLEQREKRFSLRLVIDTQI